MESKQVQFVIRCDEALRRAFAHLCVDEGVRMAEKFRQLMRDELERNERRRKRADRERPPEPLSGPDEGPR